MADDPERHDADRFRRKHGGNEGVRRQVAALFDVLAGALGKEKVVMRAGKLGALKPGYKADMVLIDLNDVGYLPYNSAARQLVYTEAGRGVETVIVDGRPVIRDRRVTTIDEDGLRREVADLMRHFVADYDKIVESRKRALPFMLQAHHKVWSAELDVPNRFVARTR